MIPRLAMGLAILGGFSVGVLHGRTAEPARDFLDQLRARKYYDHALEYLDRLPQNPLATDDIKQVVALEAGLTLCAEANSLRDAVAREQKLDAAQQRFTTFLKDQPEHPLVAMAQTQLANISMERAVLLIQRADRTPRDKDKLLADARNILTQAQGAYSALNEQARKQLKELQEGGAPPDSQATAKRDEFRRQWVESRLKLADVAYQKSKTVAAGTADQKTSLTEAADQYGGLADDFKLKVVGLRSRVLQGICYQEMGERAKALGAYDMVLAIPEESDKDFRDLKTKALRQSLECWLADEKYEDAVRQASAWVAKSRGTEDTEPDWLATKYLLAKAIERQLASGATANTQQATRLAQAKHLAQDAARVKGEYQAEATTLLAQLNKISPDKDKKPEKEPTTFEEANERASLVLDEIAALNLQIQLGESSKEPDQAKQVAEWKQQLADKQGAAAQAVRTALMLRKDTSPINDVNRLRYTLAYFLFNQGEYYDAAAISDYVARRFPEYELAQACGEIALKAYVRLYQTSPEDKSKRDFEAAQIASIASYLINRWPAEEAAQEAVNWVVYLAIDRQELDKATAMLDKLPADSPARAEAQIRIGRMLWSEYQRSSRLKDESRPAQRELDKLLARAQSALEAGVKAAMDRDQVTPGMLDGGLALVQMYLDQSHPDKAISVLENEKIGPLTLANANNPAAQREAVAFEIYRSALRAYITVQPPRLDDAAKVMDQLDQAAGTDPKASEAVTQVYMVMGRDLQRQLEDLRGRNDAAGMKAISQAVEQFLKRISARQQSASFSVLNWVADTFYSLGAGFDKPGAPPSAQAKAYYRQAVQTYEKVLSQVKKDEKFAPSEDALTGVQLRLAICRRGLGEPEEFKQAVATFADILREKPTFVSVQVEAARTYQAWAALDPANYGPAIRGTNMDRKTGENTIWGWGKIGQIMHNQLRRSDLPAEQQTSYRTTFHEARYNLALCRYRAGLLEKNKKEQTELYQSAKRDILFTYELYPDLGGDEWKTRYVALLKNIQKELGEPQNGLEAAADANKTSASSK